MSYQVLARKWRPRSFQEMVGQHHVVKALMNALDQGRLHHAYLFTGTRGVGKTTIARILAKCLNCEQAVTSVPCGQCQHCQEIDAGRFFDLIEIDAASRTRVEDMRDLLGNAHYAPTKGRYKIILIDEVHMLSGHSFNALLKTLEEPPAHVKFLLATTDPQRLPVTVLSRCLQFHMKNLSPDYIAKHLGYVLTQENISYQAPALDQLGRAADGSLRDALSLLDQAIAYGNNQVTAADVQSMLGCIESRLLLNLLSALIDNNANVVLTTINELAEAGADFADVLEELLSLLYQVALHKAVPDAPLDLLEIDKEYLIELARRISQEDVHLYYQIGLIGRRDLPLAPTPRGGFTMVLLRMLNFRPTDMASTLVPVAAHNLAQSAQVVHPTTASNVAMSIQHEWPELLKQLNLQGTSLAVALHCAATVLTESELHLELAVDQAPLLSKAVEQRISQSVQEYFKKPLAVAITVAKTVQETPAMLEKQKREQQQESAVRTIMSDGNVQAIINMFNATLIPGMAQLINDYNFSET